jgi:uncharacterized damage-inducible protein DinB
MMKRVVMCCFLWGAAVVLAGVPVRAADNFAGPLKAQWENIRNNIVKSVEAVPEDKYDYRPVPGVRSFRELFLHIADENYFFMGRVSGEKAGASGTPKTRAEIVKALNDSYDYGAKILDGMTDEKAVEMVPGPGGRQMQRWAIALANIADNMDHYGNLVVYMRLNGIVPPSSAPRQR